MHNRTDIWLPESWLPEFESMFIDNRFTKEYFDLMKYRKENPLFKKDGYCEEHHIIPKCVNEDHSSGNLVNLLPEEHYRAHQILMNCAKGWFYGQMIHTMKWMTDSKKYGKILTESQYAFVKKESSKAMSKMMKGQTPWNKGKSHAEETKDKIRESAIERALNPTPAMLAGYEKRRGKPSPNLGKKHKPESIQKMRESAIERALNPTPAMLASYENRKGSQSQSFGKKRSPETILKMKAAKSGKNNPRYGVPVTDETRDRIRKKLMGREYNPTPEERKRRSDAQKGRKRGPMSEEAKRKSKETKLRNSNGKTSGHSEEHKRKISQALIEKNKK